MNYETTTTFKKSITELEAEIVTLENEKNIIEEKLKLAQNRLNLAKKNKLSARFVLETQSINFYKTKLDSLKAKINSLYQSLNKLNQPQKKAENWVTTPLNFDFPSAKSKIQPSSSQNLKAKTISKNKYITTSQSLAVEKSKINHLQKKDVLLLINSQEIKAWQKAFDVLFVQQNLTMLKLAEKSKNNESGNDAFLINEQEEDLIEKYEELENKIKMFEKKKNKVINEYIKADAKNNFDQLKSLEQEKKFIDNSLIALNTNLELHKNKIKQIELKNNQEKISNNTFKGLDLSIDSKALRDIERAIWKMILDIYFVNDCTKIIVKDQYDQWTTEFIDIANTIEFDEIGYENMKNTCNIVKTAFIDIARDIEFIEQEKIIIDSKTNIISEQRLESQTKNSIMPVKAINDSQLSNYKPTINNPKVL